MKDMFKPDLTALIDVVQEADLNADQMRDLTAYVKRWIGGLRRKLVEAENPEGPPINGARIIEEDEGMA